MTGETREDAIKRLEAMGYLDPACPGCAERYAHPGMPFDVMGPNHKASNGCESGKRAHCSCDSCF